MSPTRQGYLSVKETAQILGQTRQEIVRKIWRGFIKVERVGREYIVPESEVKRLKKSRGKK